jgi:epoxyqueuosine reductase
MEGTDVRGAGGSSERESPIVESFISEIRSEARRLGFTDVGFAGPDASDHGAFYREWVKEGFHGSMTFLARPGSIARREDLTLTMESVQSIVVVSQNYFQPDPPGVPQDAGRGVIARYARGEDYHDVMKGRLQELLVWIRERVRAEGLAEGVRGFPYVDTGPILERELAGRAGLGWFGRNTLLIHPERGSYSFLGLLLLDLPLPVDPPFLADRCGSCQACLPACPTGALLGRDHAGAPVLDARKCISYLTIELKGPIPRELRPAMGNRIFGCDICQECCPWNLKFAEGSTEPAYVAGPDTDGPELVELMGLSEDEFAARFSGSPVQRARRRGLLRNVAVALGNWGSREAVPALASALDDEEPLIRGHAAWALGRILSRVGIPGDGGFEVAEALLFRLHEEDDPWVEEEIEEALRGE